MLYNYQLYLQYQLNMDRGGYRGTYGICIYMAIRLQLDRLWVLRTGKRGLVVCAEILPNMS